MHKWCRCSCVSVLQCHPTSHWITLVAVVIEMPAEQDDSYTKYQMLIQTGLKWPKDIGVCRWNHFHDIQIKSCLFQMEQNSFGPEVKIAKHQTCPNNTNAIWKGLHMLGTLFSWNISCLPFCACQANWGEGGGDLTTPGDLRWESSSASKQSSSHFLLGSEYAVFEINWLFISFLMTGNRDWQHSSAGCWCYRER